ncbi:Ran-binding protein 10 [Liparis tanakae]|uniref:Ran-binding protein 10 n=1 Tax=Liparis tanakae TaxID=230148 RepID=A0A4Z2EIB6_9TELE|nr:Ran-binding protein 10 [Liparis tanakae]
MIQFGRELQVLNEQLCREYGKNAAHKKMLQLQQSGPRPRSLPLGPLTGIRAMFGATGSDDSVLRAAKSQNLPKQPPLMLALGQATECVQLMARVRSGSCSFARVDNFLH